MATTKDFKQKVWMRKSLKFNLLLAKQIEAPCLDSKTCQGCSIEEICDLQNTVNIIEGYTRKRESDG